MFKPKSKYCTLMWYLAITGLDWIAMGQCYKSSPIQIPLGTTFVNHVISYEPPNCTVPPAHSVAIIIPFRDNKEQARSHQLFIMLHFMIPILIRQNIKFQFFLITQESFIQPYLGEIP